ncbi:MAG: DUF4838 domain-containing protein, partial [Kiritimatiellia bacterium]
MTGLSGYAGELIIAASNQCTYQIVLPDSSPHPIIGQTISNAAGVMREMFKANGFTIHVVNESMAERGKPGIYLGDTAAARAAGIGSSRLPVWTYVWKTDGCNVIIAGRDWAAAKIKEIEFVKDQTPCSHGTVKGLTDFMRQFCGTRFLAPGGLPGIEFLPTPTIAVPDNLDVRKEPMLSCNSSDRATTDIAKIALNFFDNVTMEYFTHTHQLAVPAEKYAATHPEYFALVNGQRIRERPHAFKAVMVKEPHLCYSNKDVQELIYREFLRSFDAGYPEYLSVQADGFRPCECDECRKMFGTADWGEKLWRLNKRWAERLITDRPGKFLVAEAYTVTFKPPASFKIFPPNMRVSVGSYPKAFEIWDGYTIPGGFSAYLHAWGWYHLCGYLPVRTPLYAEKVVRLYEKYNVKHVGLDSPPATMWCLEGPTVYVYSRMLDDVKNSSALKLVEEYIQAAYGKAAMPMGRFFDELHHTLEIYAEVFGVDNGTFQGYTRADGRGVRY